MVLCMEESPEKMPAEQAEQDDAAGTNRKCPCSHKRPPKIGDLVVRKPPNPKQRVQSAKEGRQAAAAAVDEVPPSKLGFKAAASLARARAKAVEGFREAGTTVDDIVVGIDFIYIS